MMAERNTDMTTATVLLAVNFIQIYGLIYDTRVSFPFRDDLYHYIASICDVVRIYPLLESYSAGAYYGVAFAFLAILLIYGLVLYLADYFFTNESTKLLTVPVQLLSFLSTLLFWVFMMPIFETYIAIFDCETGGTHRIDTGLQCWGGLHIFLCVLFSVALAGYLAIFVLISFFYNESRPNHTDALRRLDLNLELYLVMFKLLIVILTHFLRKETWQWVLIVTHLLFSSYFSHIWFKYLPYYNIATSVIFGACWINYFWISANLLLLKALEGTNRYQGQTIVIIIGMLLVFPLTYQVREKKILRMMYNKKHDKIRTEYQLDLYINKIYRLIIDSDINQPDELILVGIVNSHKQECLNPECPLLDTKKELYLPALDAVSDRKSPDYKDIIVLYHLIQSIYSEYARNTASSVVLHTSYAYFLIFQVENFHMAVQELNAAQKCENNYQQSFTIYRSTRLIEQHLDKRYGKNAIASRDAARNGRSIADLDVSIVITFDHLFLRLNKEIEKSANDHIEFWSHLESPMVDLNVLHKLGLNIINNTKRINDLWWQLTRINSNYSKALQLYGNYLIQIKNDITEGEEFIMKASSARRAESLLDENQIEDGAGSRNKPLANQFDMMFADDTAVIVISGNKETQAKILKTNSGITKLFGYNIFEVIGHEINILQPPVVSRVHHMILEQYFRTGRERIINVDVPVFGMMRSGHIFPINAIVKPVPSLKNDIQIIGLIKPSKKTDYEYIITDLQGKIDCISKGITTLLQVQPAFFKDNEIYIQVLCPQLCEAERDRKTKDLKTRFDLWTYPAGSENTSFKDLTYIIPKNLINYGQKGGAAKTSIIEQPGKQDGFVGVRSADSLKKVSNMFRSQQYDDQPKKYAQIVHSNINYENPDVIKGPIKTEIVDTNYANGILKFKIFKLLLTKGKNGILGVGDDGESESEHSGANPGQGSGEKNLKAMIEDAKRAIALSETSSTDMERRILKMKSAYEMIKRGIRHASLRAKPSNIITPDQFEREEMMAYSKEIRQFESQLRKMKIIENVEIEKSQQNFDLLQVDQNVDYQKIKGAFPLKSNQHLEPPKAIGEQEQIISVTELSGGFKSSNPDPHLVEETQKEIASPGEEDEEDHQIDFLKDLRAQPGFNSAAPLLPGKKKIEALKENSDALDEEQNKEKDGEEKKNDQLVAEEEKFLTEDTGSVSSSTKSIAQHLRMLRSALFENYIPPSIQNLHINARIVFFALFVLTLIQYIYSKSIYSQLNDNLANIYSSKNRMISLNNIGADSRALSAMRTGLINKTRGTRDYEKFKRERIGDAVTILQGAQNNLSQSYLLDIFDADNKNLINSPSVQLIFNSPAALPMFQYLDIWSSLMTLSIHALSIQVLPLTLISRNETSVFFVLTNTFNNLLQSISDSTSALLKESSHISSSVHQTLMYLLIAASCALAVSLCLILPVAMQVDQDKDALLRHFMLIDREDVMKQLEKCRLFFNTMHDKEHAIGMVEGQEDDLGNEEAGAEPGTDGTPGEAGEEQQHKVKKSRKGKMHKKYSNNFIALILKFLVVLTILEGYFVLIFVQSGDFLDVALNLIRESGTITIRHFGNNFLYQIMQEVLTTNGRGQVINQNSLTFMFSYLNETIREQENFLKEHDANSAYHSSEFNSFFDKLIYQNVCSAITLKDTECENFMGGILKKGLYSANVAYWDNMRSMATDYNNSARSTFNSSIILNSGRLIENEVLKDQYFEQAYTDLLFKLNDSIRYNFNQRDSQDTILFACYIVILFMLYFIIWKKFMETTRHSLWVTKSMLAIIPLDIIQKVPKIKDFLLASSKSSS